MTTRRRKQKPELLGVHGIVLASADPAKLARRWTALTGLEPLRRTRREILLGGPALFVLIRKVAGSTDRIEEVHLAVKEIAVTRRKTNRDPVGGDSWKKSLGDLEVVMRQFRRAPARTWRRRS
ncbi:MAG TPA: hypothetical protein VIY96_02110 [Thermoanaerobaculia bacterium]